LLPKYGVHFGKNLGNVYIAIRGGAIYFSSALGVLSLNLGDEAGEGGDKDGKSVRTWRRNRVLGAEISCPAHRERRDMLKYLVEGEGHAESFVWT
jgi:hypothetical protein